MTTLPLLNVNLLPPEERDAGRLIESGLFDLRRFVNNFEHALSLFVLLERSVANIFQATRIQTGAPTVSEQDFIIQCRHWQSIAQRDGAVTLYNVGESMEGIKQNLHLNCPSWREHVREGILKSATTAFNKHFPDAEHTRHSVSHAGELSRSAKKEKRNSFTGNYLSGPPSDPLLLVSGVTNLTIRDGQIGDEFVVTFGGRVRSYRLSAESLNRLREIESQFYSAFDPAIKKD
jgi:hypothetical protein